MSLSTTCFYTLITSCLENPRDRGAWWAAVYGVAQSRTRLNRLSSSSSNAYMYGCESWTIKKALKNWCFWTVVSEKTLESLLDCKEIQPVNPKGNQSCIFIGRTVVEAENPILWPPDAKSWLIGKDPDAGKELKAGGEGDDRGWDGWMTSLTWWMWVWASSESWWWTGKTGALQSMGS